MMFRNYVIMLQYRTLYIRASQVDIAMVAWLSMDVRIKCALIVE